MFCTNIFAFLSKNPINEEIYCSNLKKYAIIKFENEFGGNYG